MMAELSEESVVFLRVRPGHVERALSRLRQNPLVKEAEAIMGRYDIAVAASVRNAEELRKLQSEFEAEDFCDGSFAHPAFESWRREGPAREAPVNAWTLIRAANAERAMRELQRLPMVERIIGTTGEYNLIARIGAKDTNELQSGVLRDIQRVEGVRRTETRAAIKAP
jgi:DNA-binding Lrp family transcriptional regulator